MTEPSALASGLQEWRDKLGPRPVSADHAMGPEVAEEARMAAAVARQQQRAAAWALAVPSRFAWAQPADLAEMSGGSDIAEWADKPGGRNLVLLGPTGVGKTHAAVAAVRPMFDHGLDLTVLPVVELLDQLRPGGPADALADLCGVDLLVMDDLGVERGTEWTAERMYAVVNRRWMEERPTVATSNLAPADLEQAVGPRLFSRLVGNDAVVVQLTGRDRRRA